MQSTQAVLHHIVGDLLDRLVAVEGVLRCPTLACRRKLRSDERELIRLTVLAALVGRTETLSSLAVLLRLSSISRFRAALRSAFTMFLQLASDEPLIHIVAVSAGEGDELYRLVTTLGRQLAGDTVADLVPQIWPQVGADDARLLADSLVRLAISHALVPADDPERVADGVSRVFARYVDELLAS